MKNSVPQIFVGVDVSKNHLDVNIYPLKMAFTVANSNKGIQEIMVKLAGHDVGQIVCEATGGYEYLVKTQLNAWVVEPKRIQAFIRSEGINAKTDKIDAGMLALFAAQKKPKHTSMQLSADEKKLKALNNRRSELIAMITQESNRLQQPQQIHCKNDLKKHVLFLKKQLTKIDKEIEQIIKNNDVLSSKAKIMESIPGVGQVTTSVLISSMPELGKINNKQLAALVGIAPFDKQSGSYRGKSIIKGGRHEVRKVLYMAAVVASRFNPKLKMFYQRLLKAGKKPKTALVAIMRKLIIILNVMIQKGEAWDPKIV
jgi:transposase